MTELYHNFIYNLVFIDINFDLMKRTFKKMLSIYKIINNNGGISKFMKHKKSNNIIELFQF